jgi:hypothetical protein
MILFDGNYGRTGTIRVERRECEACKETKRCLVVDSSEGEYHPGVLCLDCIEDAFKGGEDPPMTEKPDMHRED